jgi:hypothetical protein
VVSGPCSALFTKSRVSVALFSYTLAAETVADAFIACRDRFPHDPKQRANALKAVIKQWWGQTSSSITIISKQRDALRGCGHLSGATNHLDRDCVDTVRCLSEVFDRRLPAALQHGTLRGTRSAWPPSTTPRVPSSRGPRAPPPSPSAGRPRVSHNHRMT